MHRKQVNVAYKQAVEATFTTSRSCLIQGLLDYLKTTFQNWNAMRTELFRDIRTHKKFKRYQTNARVISSLAKTILQVAP